MNLSLSRRLSVLTRGLVSASVTIATIVALFWLVVYRNRLTTNMDSRSSRPWNPARFSLSRK
ncbi:hypothetical protein E2C01_000136 [Portunus trituberculatus]|uniref:Uncharacterized protein n=1 Tax=Portunus trituberculatus TaxID=210409 RepID=A0A5B7CD97_PORTR|nr:hypothetical protein [Portunus trituberculatus]